MNISQPYLAPCVNITHPCAHLGAPVREFTHLYANCTHLCAQVRKLAHRYTQVRKFARRFTQVRTPVRKLHAPGELILTAYNTLYESI